MEVSLIIAGIDEQIQKLQQARAVLSGVSTAPSAKSGRGRPKGSKNVAAAPVAAAPAVARKRKLSPEGRKRIADAMKRRWAERRKTAAK